MQTPSAAGNKLHFGVIEGSPENGSPHDVPSLVREVHAKHSIATPENIELTI